VIFKTKEFILRPAKKEDVDSLWENYDDPLVKKSFVTNPSKKKFYDDFKNGIKKKEKDAERFIIEVDGKAVGKINLKLVDPYNKTKAKIGYWIGKDYRGKGIVTKIVKLVVPFWMKKYHLQRVEARARTYNKSSARVLEKAGFHLEGVLRKNVLKDGELYDDFLYARVR
jgi:[ribosomal protein S5]-alanine N-acetyltransferase